MPSPLKKLIRYDTALNDIHGVADGVLTNRALVSTGDVMAVLYEIHQLAAVALKLREEDAD